jgi:hypothetical protein
MSAISNPSQPEFSNKSLPANKSLVEKLAIDPADLKNDRSSEPPRLGKRVSLIMFCIGVATILAWQSYGDTVRNAIAGSFPRLGWLAPQVAPVAQNTPDTFPPAASAPPVPDQQQLKAMSLDLDEVRQSVAHIATNIAASQEQITRSVDRIVASQEQMARTVAQLAVSQEQLMRTVGQLTAGQEQATREITKLQASEQQYILYRNLQPPAPKPVPRQAQERTAR